MISKEIRTKAEKIEIHVKNLGDQKCYIIFKDGKYYDIVQEEDLTETIRQLFGFTIFKLGSEKNIINSKKDIPDPTEQFNTREDKNIPKSAANEKVKEMLHDDGLSKFIDSQFGANIQTEDSTPQFRKNISIQKANKRLCKDAVESVKSSESKSADEISAKCLENHCAIENIANKVFPNEGIEKIMTQEPESRTVKRWLDNECEATARCQGKIKVTNSDFDRHYETFTNSSSRSLPRRSARLKNLQDS